MYSDKKNQQQLWQLNEPDNIINYAILSLIQINVTYSVLHVSNVFFYTLIFIKEENKYISEPFSLYRNI